MKKQSGFTVIELLAVITVAGVLVAVGIPNMQQFIKNNRLINVHNELVSAIQLARSGAIQSSGVACVCSSSSVGSGAPTCDGTNNWEAGWISFVDTNSNTTTSCVYEPGANDIMLKAWDGTPYINQVTVRSGDANINANNFIRFNARGAPITATALSLQGMFKVCDERGMIFGTRVLGRGIILSASGSVRTTDDTTQIVSCL